MDTTFIYNDHEIVLRRSFTGMSLIIDGVTTDSIKGIFKKDHDARLKGEIHNKNGVVDYVEIEYKSGGIQHFFGSAAFWLNGVKMDVRATT